MTRQAALKYLRIELIAGRHMHHCFADQAVRSTGWRRICAARRIERRLNLNAGVNL